MNVSLIQYPLIETLSFESLCEKMRSLLTQSADLHVFPELHCAELLSSAARTGEKEGEEWRQIATLFPRYFEFVKTLALETHAIIVGGTFPQLVESGGQKSIRNTCVIALPEPDGSVKVLLQEKLFPTQTERVKWKWQGGDQILSFEHQGYRIATLVCYDIEFPQVSQLLTELKPHLILVPSCTSAHYGYNRVRWCAQARAIEHFAYVAVTGTVGSLKTSPSFDANEGQAYLLSPSEQGYPRIVSEGPLNRAAQTITEISLDRLEKDRARVGAYPGRDQVLYGKDIHF